MRFYAKLPSQVVALSLVACLVVVGAPALVSIIDDSDNSIVYTADGLEFVDWDTDNLFVFGWESGTPENLVNTYTTSEIGSFIFSFGIRLREMLRD